MPGFVAGAAAVTALLPNVMCKDDGERQALDIRVKGLRSEQILICTFPSASEICIQFVYLYESASRILVALHGIL